jgi:hypothetical protein
LRRVIIASVLMGIILGGGGFLAAKDTGAACCTAYDADINHDGFVNGIDLGWLATYYGQAAPLPPPPEPHEAVVTEGTFVFNAVAAPVDLTTPAGPVFHIASFSPANYPSSATFHLTASAASYPGGPPLTPGPAGFCMGMEDTPPALAVGFAPTVPSPVVTCGPGPYALPDVAFVPSPGLATYAFYFAGGAPPPGIYNVRVVARWTENVP